MTTVRDRLGVALRGTADRWLLARLCAAAASGRSLLLVTGAVVNGLLPTATLLAVAAAVAQIPHIPASGGLSSAAGRRLVVAVTVALLSAVLAQVVAGVQRIYAETVARRAASALRHRAMAAVERAVRAGILDDPDLAGDVREVSDVEGRRPLDPAVIGITDALSARLGALGPLLVVGWFRWWLAILLAAAWIGTRAVLGAANRKRMTVLFGQNERLRRAHYFREFGTAPESAKEIRIFGLSAWVTERFRDHWARTMTELWSERATARLPLTLSLLAVGVTNVGGALLLVHAAAGGEVALGAFVAVAQAIVAAAGIAGLVGVPGVDRALVPVRATRTLEDRCAAAQPNSPRTAKNRASAAMSRLDLPRGAKDQATAVALPRSDLRRGAKDQASAVAAPRSDLPHRGKDQASVVAELGGRLPAAGRPLREVRLEGARFRYRAGEHDAVGPIDLTIATGAAVALVGANGAGKTTLAKLIMGLHQPIEGRVLVDDVDLADYDQDDWWSNLGVLFQNFGRYPATVTDNIVSGARRRLPDDGVPARDRVAAQLGLAEIVDRLPHGWDTELSPAIEGGVDLSGGQWQRVALARALFAVETGARLIVLDEPTANLDVLAEVEFFDRFLELRRGVTTILISHRFPAVRSADLIVVLDGGRIVEQGTHADLMDRHGRYRSMFDLQAAAYRA
jgi:ATP-binding cassette subfamily B protein